MTKELAQEGEITERDKVIFAAYQTSGSAIITNYFSSGVAVFAFLGTSVIVPLAVIPCLNLSELTFCASGLTSKNVATQRKERKHDNSGPQNVMDMFIDGARRGFTIATTNLLPNVVMAFVIIQALKITGLLDWVGHICEPVMALWGLPGEAATVL